MASAAVVVLFGVHLDRRQDLDQLARLLDQGAGGLLQARVGVDEEAQPVARFPSFLSGDGDLGAEVWLV